jgi:hypothetical protein
MWGGGGYRHIFEIVERPRLTMRPSLPTLLIVLSHVHSALSYDTQHDKSKFKPEDIIVRDVAIIGGGSSGTHAAISLKDKGKSIVVVEQKARLGGHTETYTDPATGITQEYGVVVYHNQSVVQNYFKRFNIPLTPSSFGSPRSADYDLRTGKAVNVTHPDQQALGTALQKYAAFLSKYPSLEAGMFLPSPVPADLTMPFGEFAIKYGIGAAVQTFYQTNPGLGDILSVPVVENARVVGLDLIQQLSSNGLLTTARHNNSELYGAAQTELLASSSLLLSSTVSWSSRTNNSVELIVSTPHGKKLICAKKLLITIPPRLSNLRSLDLSHQEAGMFAKLIDAGYYVALVNNTGIPDDLLINNYAQNTRFNLPELPGVYLIQPTAIPGLKAIYYGSPRTNHTSLSDASVKSAILKSIATLQKANPSTFNQTVPEIVVYTNHAPFYLQAKPEDTAKGFYSNMYALQGGRSTWWSGAAWRAQDSSALWKFNEEIVLPGVLGGL